MKTIQRYCRVCGKLFTCVAANKRTCSSWCARWATAKEAFEDRRARTGRCLACGHSDGRGTTDVDLAYQRANAKYSAYLKRYLRDQIKYEREAPPLDYYSEGNECAGG